MGHSVPSQAKLDGPTWAVGPAKKGRAGQPRRTRRAILRQNMTRSFPVSLLQLQRAAWELRRRKSSQSLDRLPASSHKAPRLRTIQNPDLHGVRSSQCCWGMLRPPKSMHARNGATERTTHAESSTLAVPACACLRLRNLWMCCRCGVRDRAKGTSTSFCH